MRILLSIAVKRTSNEEESFWVMYMYVLSFQNLEHNYEITDIILECPSQFRLSLQQNVWHTP